MSQALEQKYRALQNNDRFIVQLFSLLYSAVSRSTALQCLNVARQAGNLHTLTTTQFADQVRKLINSGLLISVDGSGVICPTDLREIVARHALQEGTFKSIVNAIQSGHSFQSNSYLTRDLRLYIYQQNARKINKLLSLQPSLMPVFKSTLVDVFNNPFDLAWLEEFSLDMQEAAMQATLEESIWQGDPADSFFDLLEQWFNQGTRNENIDLMYVEQLWLRGRLTEAIQIFNSVPQRPPSDRTIAFLGTVAFLENRVEESLVFFRKAISLGAKTNKAKIEWFSKYPTTLMYFFAALKVGSAAALKEAQRYAELIYLSVNWLSPAMAPLLGVLAQRQGTQNLTPQTDFLCKENYAGVPALLEMYCLYWLSIPKLGTRISPHLLRCFRNASRAGYDWIAVEVAELLIHLDCKEDLRPIVESLRDSKCCPLMQTLERNEPWEVSLQA